MKQLLITSAISVVAIFTLCYIMVNQHDKYIYDLNEKKEEIHQQADKINKLNKVIKYNQSDREKLQQQVQSLNEQNEQLNQKVEELQNELDSIGLFEVTAYTSNFESTGKTPNHPAYKITASGERVEDNVTVACPPSLEFGTELYIQDVGHRVCTDRGGKITEGKLDVYIADLKEALEFGRQFLRVKILKSGE